MGTALWLGYSKDLKNILIGDRTRCKCFDRGIKNRNAKIRTACIHQFVLKIILEGCASLIIQYASIIYVIIRIDMNMATIPDV